jgi:uncharacterized membrane protein
MEESRKEIEEEIEKRMAEEVEKRVEKGVATGVTILVSVAITFVITMVVFKFVWAWVVSDLFPGAVAQGLINAELTWLASLKLAVFVGVLSGVYPTFTEAVNQRL